MNDGEKPLRPECEVMALLLDDMIDTAHRIKRALQAGDKAGAEAPVLTLHRLSYEAAPLFHQEPEEIARRMIVLAYGGEITLKLQGLL